MAIKKENSPKAGYGKITIGLSVAFLLVLSFLASCKKDPKKESKTTSAKDIYVAGTEFNGTNYIAKLWHNGVAINLTDGTNNAYANKVIISDTDVYVKGIETIGKIDIGKIWKNGKLIFSTDSRFTNNLKSIFVDGKDVYAVGNEYDPSVGVSQKIWKNGTLLSIVLNHDTSDIYSIEDIFVKGGDIYIAGTVQTNIRTGQIDLRSFACYWKNGVLNKMPIIGDKNLNWGMNIFVEGTKVHLLGRGQEGAGHSILFWENNTLVFKDALYNSYTNSFYVSNGNTYATGSQLSLGTELRYDGSNKWFPFLYSNGKYSVVGTNGSNYSDVKVLGADTYISGFNFIGGKNVATIWKNGIAENLTDGTKDAAAYSIFVK